MMKTIAAIVLLAPIALPLLGCAVSATPNYDARFGDAVRQARTRMILNPNAGANRDQALGLDGKAAHEAALVYEGSFKAPPPVVNVINIGGATGGK